MSDRTRQSGSHEPLNVHSHLIRQTGHCRRAPSGSNWRGARATPAGDGDGVGRHSSPCRWLRSPALTAYRWKKLVAECRRQAGLLQPGRYMEVRYEDLTAEPEFWLRQLCDFLALPFDAAILQSSRPYLHRPELAESASAASRLQANSGKWQSVFGTATQRRLELIAGRMLRECGYETRYPDSDVDLSPLLRRVLSGKDAVVQFGREVILKLQGKIERPWRVILAKPFAAIRQRALNKF